MKWLTDKALIKCGHSGRVQVLATQNLVSVGGHSVLVGNDPVAKGISSCPNYNVAAGMKPCTFTLAVNQGKSDLININGKPVCLDTLSGFTDGTPPGAVLYDIHAPGQSMVEEII